MRRENQPKGGGVLPSGYTQLEYIESTGTQWIDSGVNLNPQIEWYLDIQWLQFNNVNAFGQENWQNPGPIVRVANDNRGNPTLGINIVYGDAIGGQYAAYVSYNLSTSRTTFLLKNGHQYVNGIEVAQGNMTLSESYWSVIYFASRGNENIQYNCRRARHYYSYFKEYGEKIREFIPALRLSDSKPGLFDTINNTFYTNAGTGEFLYA